MVWRSQIHYQLSVFLCAILPLVVYAWLGRMLHDQFEDPKDNFARRPMLLVGVTLLAGCLAFSLNFAKWSKLKQAGTLLLAWVPALSGLLWESIYMQRPTIAIDSLLCTGLVLTWGLRKVSKGSNAVAEGAAAGSRDAVSISEAKFATWVSWAWSLSASVCLATALIFAIDVNKKHPHEITFKMTPLQGFVVCGFVAVLAHNAAKLASIAESSTSPEQEQLENAALVERQVRLCCYWLAASGSIFSVVFTIHVKTEGDDHKKSTFRNELSGLALFITFVVACFLYRLYASVQSGKLPLPVSALPTWIVGTLNSEWVRAVGLVLFLPLSPFVALLFIVRRRYRRRWHSEEEGESIDAMPLGDLQVLTRVSVVRNACIIVLLYISFVVFAKDLLDGVMAALDKVCDGMSFFSLSITLVSSGLLLFCFPATTGAPLYVVAGRVCVKQFYEETLQNEQEYRPSLKHIQCIKGIMMALVLSAIMKLGACYIEQKGFGELLGKREWVRRAVGVHTRAIRATEGLLKGERVLPKVCILLGGPDWPTSVLCGILNLPIGKILLLTSPAVIQGGGPSILVGACTFLATDARARCKDLGQACGEEQVFHELGGQALVVAAGMQFGLAMLACKFIHEEYQSGRHDHERPEDRPLIEMTEKSEQASAKAWIQAEEDASLKWVRISFMVSLVGLLVTALLSAAEVQAKGDGFWLVLGLLTLSSLPFAVASRRVSLLLRSLSREDEGIQLQDFGRSEAPS